MIDIAIITIYFVVVLWIGMKSGHSIQGIKEFSIGRRNFSVTVLVATLSGTLIGGGSTFGVAEKVFASGLIFLIAYCGILVERLLTSALIADKMEPFFGLITAGDVMEKLYGKTAKVITGVLTVTTSIFILGAHITTMGFILKSFLGMPLGWSLALSTFSMLIYSGYGGITAVSFTDVVQFAFMLVSIPLIALISLMDIGGFHAIVREVPPSHLFLGPIDEASIWQHGIIFLSYSLPALYPVIIQRMLMAKSTRQIKLSLWLNSILSLFFFAMIALMGLIAYVKNPSLDPKQAFPSLILQSLPDGIRGLVIVGLLATVMSTVDSFLNLIGVSFTHDILQPLAKSALTSKQQLTIARFVTVFIGIAGLVSALYFNGILENVFASMNLWLPFIFPPIFFGILRNRGSQSSFLSGIAAAASTLLLARILGYSDGFFPTVLAALANAVALLATSRSAKKFSAYRVKPIYLRTLRTLKDFYHELKDALERRLPISDIISVFTLSLTTLPIIASAGTGARPAIISIILGFSIALAAVFFILKDLWIKNFNLASLTPILPLFVAISHVTQPALHIAAHGFSPLSLVNLLLGMALSWILYPGIVGAVLLVFGTSAAFILSLCFAQDESSYGAVPQAVEAIIRLLTFVYFVLYFRKQDHHQLEKVNSLSGVLAHEVSHSVTSMNFCAHRLTLALPALLDAYRKGHVDDDGKRPISQYDLKALGELSERLREIASRTESTVQIIHTKIFNESASIESGPISLKAVIQETINSGIKESINPNVEIEVAGPDFCIKAYKGLLAHVFINLLKNALEAVHSVAEPKIIFSLQDENSVSVVDNGCGISPRHAKRIFEENYTTKKTGKGKGLHFCKMVLDEMGASITCTSQPRKTTFTIVFNETLSEGEPA